MSFLEHERRPTIRVVWQINSPLTTYGPRTLGLVKMMMDEKAVIIDTSV